MDEPNQTAIQLPPLRLPPPSDSELLESAMRGVSRVMASLAGLLMLAGFVLLWVHDGASTAPGPVALPLTALLRPAAQPAAWAMTLGILVLAVVPLVRVVLALLLYVRARQGATALWTLVTLLELLFSMLTGRH